MASTFRLRVITPTGEAVSEDVNEVTAPGTVGEFGVLADHAAFLSSLEIGALTYKAGGSAQHIAVRKGFAEVADNVMTILSEAAVKPSEVDVEQTTAELQETRAQLARMSPFDPEYAEVEGARRWAEARLAVAKR
jgi:F-type H+-transporting ATPase subunit epsilon